MRTRRPPSLTRISLEVHVQSGLPAIPTACSGAFSSTLFRCCVSPLNLDQEADARQSPSDVLTLLSCSSCSGLPTCHLLICISLLVLSTRGIGHSLRIRMNQSSLSTGVCLLRKQKKKKKGLNLFLS